MCTLFFLFFFLNLASNKYNKKYCNCYIIFIYPIILLIWEPIIFLFPIIIFILYLKNYEENLFKVFLKIFFIISPFLCLFFFIILNPLSASGHDKMCAELMLNFNENCNMALSLLKTKSKISQQFTDGIPLYKIEYFIRYILIITKNETVSSRHISKFKLAC